MCKVNSQELNLHKLKYISLEEVKSVHFQRFQNEALESNLLRICLKLFRPRSKL